VWVNWYVDRLHVRELEKYGSISGRVGNGSFTAMFRPTLGPTNCQIQWIFGLLSAENAVDHLPNTIYLHSLIRLHGVVLNYAQRQLYVLVSYLTAFTSTHLITNEINIAMSGF
jgi:hypothetical protein